MIEPGAKLDIQYPCCTLVETLHDFRLRRIHVQAVRDLIASPLTPEEYLHRPFVRRSRWLVIGFDEVAGAMRKFYLGSSRELCRPGLMRLGLYEPGATAPYAIVSRPFLETRRAKERTEELAKVPAMEPEQTAAHQGDRDSQEVRS